MSVFVSHISFICGRGTPSSLRFRNLVSSFARTCVPKCHTSLSLKCYSICSRGNRLLQTTTPFRISQTILSNPCHQKPSQHCRYFRTSKPHFIIPIGPAAWVILKPFAKVASIIAGRFVRKTYQGLNPEKKQKFRRRLQDCLGKLIIVLCVAFVVNYNYHLVETPITHRKRYIAFTDDQIMKVVTEEANALLEKAKPFILHPEQHSASYDKVVHVVKRIVAANQDLEFIEKQKWTIVVINSKEANAFVLPTGHIFVYTGLLEFASSEDKLAVVLGHEIAHALLQHGCEKLGMAQLFDYVIIFVMAAIWAFMPNDGIALVTQWFYHKVVELFLHLPFSRKLEREADIVGLELIAKACYDVREASNFWNLMYIQSELNRLDEEMVQLPEWISTHPASEKRAMALETLIPGAIKIRASCHCSHLPTEDPRCVSRYLLHMLEIAKIKKQLELEQKSSETS